METEILTPEEMQLKISQKKTEQAKNLQKNIIDYFAKNLTLDIRDFAYSCENGLRFLDDNARNKKINNNLKSYGLLNLIDQKEALSSAICSYEEKEWIVKQKENKPSWFERNIDGIGVWHAITFTFKTK